MADRLVGGLGWAEMVVLGLYSAFLVQKMASAENTSGIRIVIWTTFSVVFFLQFILGLAGIEKFLMTGKLHAPVPAVVIGGPIFRGERFFMPILFLSTIVLVGPAWCSHLCYIGSWDGLSARAAARPKKLSEHWVILRVCLLALTPVVALLIRVIGVDGLTAGYVGICANLRIPLEIAAAVGTRLVCRQSLPNSSYIGPG